jgi:GAF domain-containing protein
MGKAQKRHQIAGDKTPWPENEYWQLFDKMEQGFITAEVIRDSTGIIVDWHFLEVNSALQKHTGFHSSDLIGRPGSEIFPAEKEWWLHMIRQVNTTQCSEHIQQYFERIQRWFETIMFPFGPERFAVLYHDITDRRRRESNATVLDCVTNELAGLSDPEEILQSVGALIGDYLQVSSCSFVDIDDAHGQFSIKHNWQQDLTPSLKQTYQLKDYLTEEYILASRAGQTAVICGTANDQRTDTAAYARLNIGALVTVPFIWQDRWVASTCITSIEPRDWKAEEIALLQEISNRLFSRIERARVEEVIRRSEEKYRTLFESIDEGFCIIQLIFDSQGQPVDWLYVDVNPTFERQAGINPAGRRVKEVLPDIEAGWFPFYGDIAKTRIPARLEAEVMSLNRWFSVAAAPVGNTGDIIAVVFVDITARKLAEKTLRESEQIKSFLLTLSDALRPLADSSDIQETVARFSMFHFNADRCYYCEVIAGNNVVRRDAAREGFVSVAGSYALDKMPVFRAVLEKGKPFIIQDVTTSELIDAWQRDICVELRIISFIGVPVVKKGELKGLLCIAQSRPREWTDLELGLAEDVAFRTWTAVERGKTEQQLERELHNMRRLQQISNQLIEDDNIHCLYKDILDSATEIMNADGAAIQCFVPEKKELETIASKNMSNTGTVHHTPLITRAGNHVGLLLTNWRQPHEPSAPDLSLLDVLARQTADLIDQRQAEEVLWKVRRQLNILLKE